MFFNKIKSVVFLNVVIILFAGCSYLNTGGAPDEGLVPQLPESSAPYSVTLTPFEESLGSSKGTPPELLSVWEAWAFLNKEHVDRDLFNSKEFEEFAIKGMVEAIADPHTSYIEPKVLAIETENLTGQFEGIGAHVRQREDGAIQVISPIEGGPAEFAGIRPGDIIVAVDNNSLEGLSLLDAISKIRGPKGTEVILTVRHIGNSALIEITVIRDAIALPSVLLRSDVGDSIAHIRITEFKGDTAEQFEAILSQQLNSGSKALILDLRNNPGGYLKQVFEISDMFLDDEVVLIERRQEEEKVWMSTSEGIALDIPVVILVNKFSASASEILMGAFQDSGRAEVIGENTFGKGTVNVFRELSNGGGIYMSIGRWYTPKMRLIEGNGLEPDHIITSVDSAEAETNQVNKAMEILNDKLKD
jgi:carboxyl-terminal processing protease